MDPESIPLLQLPLFAYGETVTNIVELFPAVWSATEALASPENEIRHHGLDAIIEMGAHKVSPLVAYMTATCIGDQDIYLRRRVVYILADLIKTPPNGKDVPYEVRKVVTNFLHNIRDSIVYGLLEVSVIDPQADPSLCQLFNSCPFIGKYLGDILSQWKNPLSIRQRAVKFIGMVGYLEALPVLERLRNRLEARKSGQYLMSFAPTTNKSEDGLLPDLRIAISQLTAH